MRIDVYRILAETYQSMGEQAMAEVYLAKIPGLHFMYYEVAAAIRRGADRIRSIERAEDLCIDKLICMLWMRREEASAEARADIDAQARDMLALFKRYPMYGDMALRMEEAWEAGDIMEIDR